MCYDSIPCDAMAYLVNYNKKKNRKRRRQITVEGISTIP